jgi:hypothetical protein
MPVKIPIHPDLEAHFVALGSPKDTSPPLFPELFNKPGGGKSGLSMAFKRVMARAGIKDEVSRARAGKEGRSVSLLSFQIAEEAGLYADSMLDELAAKSVLLASDRH